MLLNLRAELLKKGYTNPTKILSELLGCSERTIRKKLNGLASFTIREVFVIVDYFSFTDLQISYLFATTEKTT